MSRLALVFLGFVALAAAGSSSEEDFGTSSRIRYYLGIIENDMMNIMNSAITSAQTYGSRANDKDDSVKQCASLATNQFLSEFTTYMSYVYDPTIARLERYQTLSSLDKKARKKYKKELKSLKKYFESGRIADDLRRDRQTVLLRLEGSKIAVEQRVNMCLQGINL